ncbi:2-oxoglutarate dehydrogenase, E2 component, dihydrolipoamide succinyltransferase, partial [Streptomyces muensis]|nr:2-oxoglutarate dehydrogenase, E2 component, dihydrolipoamide succinyltransferase [Streptomyces muensis]
MERTAVGGVPGSAAEPEVAESDVPEPEVAGLLDGMPRQRGPARAVPAPAPTPRPATPAPAGATALRVRPFR